MSDYLFMLESHLNPDQNRVVEQIEEAARTAGVNLFLTGGAVRDMLGGFQVRDLDFVVEGNALAVAKRVAESSGAELASTDEHRRSAELIFPRGITAQIAMARSERYPRKPGGRSQVSPATIHEDLLGRDFSVNAIAISLTRASRGLLLDPGNGQADLAAKQLRTLNSSSFFDDPSRLLRMVRYRVRLDFGIDERTRQQYKLAREERLEKHIPPRVLNRELEAIASEAGFAAVVRALVEENLLSLFCPALAGSKVNLPGLTKLERLARLLPSTQLPPGSGFAPFLHVLAERLSPAEKTSLARTVEMNRADAQRWQKLPVRIKKLESELKSARLRKPSQIYEVASRMAEADLLFLLYRSPEKVVQQRIRNYLGRYLPLAQSVTVEEIRKAGIEPGTRKFEQARRELVNARLDGRVRKPAPPPVVPEPPRNHRFQRAPRGGA